MNCNHTFPYWSVVPPSRCPCCGACLHPVHFSPPVMPWVQPRPWPWWQQGPYYSTTVTSSNTSTLMNTATL